MKMDKLVCFLYLLMRDELPTGVVERLIAEVERPKGKLSFSYSSLELAKYAEMLAARLRAE